MNALVARMQTLSRSEAAWLPNDLMAGMVLTTMLWPVRDTSIAVTSADMLAELEQILRVSDIQLQFAVMKDPVKGKLKRFGLFERFGAANFYPTLRAAVDAYLEQHRVDWTP